MSSFKDWVITAGQNVRTSDTKITPLGNADGSTLIEYSPSRDCIVATREIMHAGMPALTFEVTTAMGWEPLPALVLCSLKFRFVPGTDILVACPNETDGSLCVHGDFRLMHARLFMLNGKRVTGMYWYQFKPRASDYVLTCWTW